MNPRGMRGVYVVEFAIIGLLLFTLLFGVLEFGRLYFTVTPRLAREEVERLAKACRRPQFVCGEVGSHAGPLVSRHAWSTASKIRM